MIFKGSMRILFALFCAKNLFIGVRFSVKSDLNGRHVI